MTATPEQTAYELAVASAASSFEKARQIVDAIDSTELAMTVFHLMQSRFEWTGTCFTKEDVFDAWDGRRTEGDGQPESSEIADALWEKVVNSYDWRKGVVETMCGYGWEVIEQMLTDIENDESDAPASWVKGEID